MPYSIKTSAVLDADEHIHRQVMQMQDVLHMPTSCHQTYSRKYYVVRRTRHLDSVAHLDTTQPLQPLDTSSTQQQALSAGRDKADLSE